MKKKSFLVILIILFIVTSLFATGSKEKEEKKEFIQIKSSSIGGSWYAGAAAWAKLITENTKYIASNSSSTSNVLNIQNLEEGEAQLAFMEPFTAYMAYKGEGEWTKPVEVRALFGIWPGVYNIIVHEKTGIKDIYGLKGKSIATYVDGDPLGESFVELLAMHGVTPQNSKIYRIMKNDATRMFIDEKADCLIYAFGHGHSNLKEMTASRKIKFIWGDLKHIEPWLKKYPFYYYEPFGSEFGVEDGLQFIGPYLTICLASMPEDQAYLFTKVWYENWAFLLEAMPANIPWINKENPMKGIPIPIHPGAEKYFKEIGLMK
ncbi:MAG: TAXI family TRAP transporter solute-binding subunit [Spirochaetaceae bacterium]|nr:TAXI family TRAP transporter solute-binding subunit [Spirochaetaceae bacterium]